MLLVAAVEESPQPSLHAGLFRTVPHRSALCADRSPLRSRNTGRSSAYIIGLVSLGVLTSLESARWNSKGRGGIHCLISRLSLCHRTFGRWTRLVSVVVWESVPTLRCSSPSIAVLVAGLIFSRATPYKMIKANVAASVSLAIGLGLGSALKAGSALSIDSLTILFFIALGAAANMPRWFFSISSTRCGGLGISRCQ